MENRNRVFIGAPISSLGLAVVLWANAAQASQSNLCTSVPAACEFAGPDAPLLDAPVCWNGRQAKLKGITACPSGSWAYWVEHGSIDPLTGVVQPYIALDDACAHGWCSALTPGSEPPTDEGEVCCDSESGSGPCTLEVLDCAGEVLWCDGYESNDDGTVDCKENDA